MLASMSSYHLFANVGWLWVVGRNNNEKYELATKFSASVTHLHSHHYKFVFELVSVRTKSYGPSDRPLTALYLD